MLRKAFTSLLLANLVVVMACGLAIADDGGDGGGHAFENGDEVWTKVIWSGLTAATDGEGGLPSQLATGYCVRAWNKYDAAVCALGKDHNEPDLVARSKLSRPDSGGRFYTFAQKFANNGLTYPNWFYSGYLLDADYAAYGIEYARYIWWAWPVNAEEIQGAIQDYERVIAGGSANVGTGGALDGTYNMALGADAFGDISGGTSSSWYRIQSASYYGYLPEETGTKYQAGDLTLSISNSTSREGYRYYLALNAYYVSVSGGQYRKTCRYYAMPEGVTVEYKMVNVVSLGMSQQRVGYLTITNTTDSTKTYYHGDVNSFNDGLNTNWTISNANFNGSSYTLSAGESFNTTVAFVSGVVNSGGSGGGGGDDWQDPTAPNPDPDPPEVPTVPVNPTYDGGDYTNIDLTWVTNNYTVNDFSDVLDGLYEILDAMDEHCIHLQNAIGNAVNNLSRNVVNAINNLGENIEGALHSELESLKDYLMSLFSWLARQFKYTFGNQGIFDDTSILNWLKRIYARLSNIGTDTPTPNPTDDPIGFWDWLIKQFTDWLSGFTSSKVGQVGTLLSTLKDFFPFSVPWDIALMLGLLVANPVTPVFDFPLPVPTIINQTGYIGLHVDCTGWNGAAAICRAIEYFLFCYALAQKVPEWFNTIKVGDDW